MKILEIKNNLVKISYDLDDNLALSGFVIIEDTNCPYIAQIVSLKADSTENTAIVKLLFTFDTEGVLKNYNGTIPSSKAGVSNLPVNELLDVLPHETPIKLGALAQQNLPLLVDKSIFENNFIICSNKQENTNTFINNMLPQLDGLNQKTVVIDVDGEFDYENKFEFGYDFKLPLNSTTLNYIFDHDLDDVDAKSKAVIQDIFYELQEYSKTTPEQFIPFDTFIDVVDMQYRETNIPELILLKNKMLKYKESRVFALNPAELTDLADYLQNNFVSVLNISKVDGDLQRQVISYIYDVMSEANLILYSIIKLDNYNASKKLIKRFLTGGNIKTTIVCGHEFKYLQELKQSAQNFVFFAPLTTQHDFAAYNTYLAKLNPEEFVAFGDATQEIPFIVELEELFQEDLEPRTYYDDDENVGEQYGATKNVQEYSEVDTVSSQQLQTAEEIETGLPTLDDYETEELTQTISGVENLEGVTIKEAVDGENLMPESEPAEDEKTEQVSPEIIEDVEDIVVTPLYSDIENSEKEQLTEDLLKEATDEPVNEIHSSVVEETSYTNTNVLQDELSTTSAPQEIDDEQIVRDVDDIMYNKKDLDEKIPPLEDDEEVSEDDLDLIENLTATAPEVVQAQEGEETALNIEPVLVEDEDDSDELSKNTPETTEPTLAGAELDENHQEPPVVPVYPADDIPESTEIFEAGDQVTHPKYGAGVVEKMIKYGNKMLCSINFENIGRRLLDPAISDITKVK